MILGFNEEILLMPANTYKCRFPVMLPSEVPAITHAQCLAREKVKLGEICLCRLPLSVLLWFLSSPRNPDLVARFQNTTLPQMTLLLHVRLLLLQLPLMRPNRIRVIPALQLPRLARGLVPQLPDPSDPLHPILLDPAFPEHADIIPRAVALRLALALPPHGHTLHLTEFLEAVGADEGGEDEGAAHHADETEFGFLHEVFQVHPVQRCHEGAGSDAERADAEAEVEKHEGIAVGVEDGFDSVIVERG